MRICRACQETITNHRRTVYCSSRCAIAYSSKHYNSRSILNKFDSNVSSGTRGAVSELRVCVNLMRKGHAVFRAMSPACKCDLISVYKDKVYRIEVKTGHISPNGKVSCSTPSNMEYDIIAIVLRNRIIYKPKFI